MEVPNALEQAESLTWHILSQSHTRGEFFSVLCSTEREEIHDEASRRTGQDNVYSPVQ